MSTIISRLFNQIKYLTYPLHYATIILNRWILHLITPLLKSGKERQLEMKASTFTSTYLTADDVKKPLLLYITSAVEETVGRDEKLVLYADDTDENEIKVALNKTNIDKLIEIFGDDETDNWIGLPVVAYRDPHVMFNNKKVGGIAFRKPKAGVTLPARPERAVDVRSNSDSSTSDDSPF